MNKRKWGQKKNKQREETTKHKQKIKGVLNGVKYSNKLFRSPSIHQPSPWQTSVMVWGRSNRSLLVATVGSTFRITVKDEDSESRCRPGKPEEEIVFMIKKIKA